VTAAEIEAGARELLAQARGRQLAATRRQLGTGQKDIAAAMGLTIARVSQIEHSEVTSWPGYAEEALRRWRICRLVVVNLTNQTWWICRACRRRSADQRSRSIFRQASGCSVAEYHRWHA
jgi:transcriptional regulator with XRE-family HTH domain